MVLVIQLIGAGFGLFMLYLFFIHYKKKDITRLEFIVWFFMWFSFIIVSIKPKIADFVSESLSFSRTLDLFVFLGVIFVVFMTIYLYLKIRSSSTKLERLVRKLAIEKASKK